MMTNTQTLGKTNYYAAICGIKVYVDYANERLKIFDAGGIDKAALVEIIGFARYKNLGKVICNSCADSLPHFKSCGFTEEGRIEGFFSGKDSYCMSFFTDEKRAISRKSDEADKTISLCDEKRKSQPQRDALYRIRTANPSDILQMTSIFKRIFETYPSPVFDAGYLLQTMSENVLFKIAEKNSEIVGIASADMDAPNLNAEITDCATLPEHRGNGILSLLIMSLEDELISKGFKTLYSLSRAVNPGININLARLNYSYNGRLINNCHICGGYEDMNIWVKQL
ncbi:ABC-type multidrug transport system, ATPase c omponent (plasmid) [Peptoclostridium acidaminophilum DSM 3953]|uniref:ABC-type multidrug transport system, ATPase c omponent n=1 Tax=Peptoclostridium acidaminophilum DSM 3953 TaxID=1286171 RepID=W8TN12_PEPAC|nr:putative beta-lysine N-acetyltransferase [Peptoclostridium acidaminophilum]AHM57577.1 ABC-type multidrug transport system, ATPase c omponent [Peptoclostridium acidaminophilum DSM 3953]